jgi:integrase
MPPTGGRLARQPCHLPESLDSTEVPAFVADLGDLSRQAITLAMVLSGVRADEVHSLRLADVELSLRRIRQTGKAGTQRLVPVDPAFFSALGVYLRTQPPRGLPDA